MKNTNYPIGDFLIRLKNAAMVDINTVEVRNTKYIKNVAEALKRLGHVDEVKEKDGKLIVRLTFRNKKPLLTDIKIISKPGRRIYQNVDDLENHRGFSTLLISTNKGILTLDEAKKERQGGEVIAEVF